MKTLLERILALETIEKIFRIRAFLSKASIHATDQDLKVIGTYNSAINKILESMKEVLKELHDNYGDLNKNESYSCMRRISNVFKAFDNLHYRLKDIHGDWTAPETYIFVKNLFKSKDNDVSIVLSNLYMFEADDNLSSSLKGLLKYCSLSNEMEEISPTLFLPKIEYSNPLNWSILAHEMGHVLKKPLEKILSENEVKSISATADGITMVNKWTEEVWCDLIATKVLGPSYLASYIIFSLLTADLDSLAIEKDTPTHPSHRFRISIIKDFLDKTDMQLKMRGDYFKINNMSDYFEDLFEDRCEYAKDNNNKDKDLSLRSPLPIDTQKLRDLLIDKLDDLTHENIVGMELDAEKIKLLTDRLALGFPIGSSIENQDVETALTKLEEINKRLDNKECVEDNEMDSVYAVVKETPCHIGEIINAGWQYKYEKMYPKMIDLFFSKKEDINNCYKILNKEIALLDDKLRKSIEISHIHSLFAEEIDSAVK